MTREYDKSVKTAFGSLGSSLCLPEDRFEFRALILAGNGALDINGTGLQVNLYNALAHQLAENGVASFQYDKRGCGESDG